MANWLVCSPLGKYQCPHTFILKYITMWILIRVCDSMLEFCYPPFLYLSYCLVAYKQEQKEKKEAAADRKKKQQAAAAAAAAIAVSSQVMAEPVTSGGEASGVTLPGGLVGSTDGVSNTGSGGDNDEAMEVDVNSCTTQIPAPVTVVASSIPTGT